MTMIRCFLWLHLSAVVLTAWSTYLDQHPAHETGVAMMLMNLGMLATMLFPLYPIASLTAIGVGAKDWHQGTLLTLLVFATTVAHCVAALPLVS